MAQRRMFSMKIVDTDAFLDMSQGSQLLYFHLSMRADDDGFVSNPKKIMRMAGINEDDYKVLKAKRFLIGFESGVVVIKHWKIHNYIANDRYHKTSYLEELDTLNVKENNSYTECRQDVYKLSTEARQGKVRLGKASISIGEKAPSHDVQSFEYLWDKEIKKTKKSRAKTLYLSLLKNGVYSAEQILEMRDKHQSNWNAQGKSIYITTLANWIRDEGWEDDNNQVAQMTEADIAKMHSDYIIVYKKIKPDNWTPPADWSEIVKEAREKT